MYPTKKSVADKSAPNAGEESTPSASEESASSSDGECASSSRHESETSSGEESALSTAEDLDETQTTATSSAPDNVTASKSAVQLSREKRMMWKCLSDDEYYLGPKEPCVVPERSFFTYLPVEPQQLTMPNIPLKPPLHEVLTDMIEGNKGATTKVQIGSRVFKCIPTLLRCYSVWFANRDWRMTNFLFTELDVPAVGFEALYLWMRLQTPVLRDQVVFVLQAVKHLKVDILENQCWEMLSEVREKVAFQLFKQAHNLPLLEDFRELMLDRLRFYFLALVGHEDFVELSCSDLVEIISRDSIGVNSEIEVFFAVLRWMNKMPEQRQTHLRRLMSCVRFPYMPMAFLFRLKDGCNRPEVFATDPTLYAFHMDPHTQNILETAITFISVRCQYDNNEKFFAVCSEHKLKMIRPRKWVYNPHCKYHKSHLVYPYEHQFSTSDFNAYLTSIQLDWLGDGPQVPNERDVEHDGMMQVDKGRQRN